VPPGGVGDAAWKELGIGLMKICLRCHTRPGESLKPGEGSALGYPLNPVLQRPETTCFWLKMWVICPYVLWFLTSKGDEVTVGNELSRTSPPEW
jgi:hypothetical protein